MLKEALLYEKLEKDTLHCYLCNHNCHIVPDRAGFCGVRKNIDGKLYTLVYAQPIAANPDPIEKKPLYHFLPGSRSFSIATIGCNFKCGFCQNWQISQLSPQESGSKKSDVAPQTIVNEAKKSNCSSIAYTYTEPTIFFEYAYDSAKLAKENGLKNVFVTNGFMSKEAITEIQPYLDAANVDLKSFSEEFYRKNCKASLKPVLENIEFMKKNQIWVEVTTLIIPGENDSLDELRKISDFIAGVDRDIPWHISKFHPDYKFGDHKPTGEDILIKAQQAGTESGLNYIYLGNVSYESDTTCPECGKSLVKRRYFDLLENNIKEGKCKFCQAQIAGVFE